MSSQSEKAAFALQDILLGIAEGLNSAQQNLRSIEPYDEYGRANTMYEVPYLDFNLQVTSEFQEKPAAQSTGLNRKSYMRFMPVSTMANPSEKTALNSVISGRFVAIAPNEGLPQTVIEAKPTISVGATCKVTLDVHVENSVGEKLAGSLVEFNFDEETSQKMNGGTLPTPPTFSISEKATDENGAVQTEITIPLSEYNGGKYYVFQINVGTVNKKVSVNKD